MHAKVKEGDNKQETTRGASLRELQHFFEKEDSSKGYAGLRRIADEDGTAVWTILKETEVAAQLEKRAGERREEDGGDTAALGLEVERLKVDNEKQKQLLTDAQNQKQLLIEAAAGSKKDMSCGCANDLVHHLKVNKPRTLTCLVLAT